MGFGTRSHGGGSVYAGISKGSIVVTCKKGDSYGEFKAVSRQISKGKREGELTYELHFPNFEGHILDVYISASTGFGKQFNIRLVDKAADPEDPYKKVIIQFPIKSEYFVKFVQSLGSINLNSPIDVVPYYLEKQNKKGKYNSGLRLYQNGSIVPFYIPKEELPALVEEEDAAGEKSLNNDDRLRFLIREFDKWCKKNKKGEHKEEESEEEYSPNKKTQRQVVDDDEEDHDPRSKKKPKPSDDDDDEEENPY